MPDNATIDRARRNGESNYQYNEGVSINVDQLVDMLVESSAPGRHASIRRGANQMLEEMAHSRWRISAGPHTGGREGAPQADYSKHITVRVYDLGTSYHLRLDSRGFPFQITVGRQNNLQKEPKPWQAPGQPVG